MKKKHFLAGVAVLFIMVMFTLAGYSDPVIRKDVSTGNLRIVNKHRGEISRVYVHQNGGGVQAVWDAYPKYLDYSNGKVIVSGAEKTFPDIPAGTWRIELRGIWIDDVEIAAGLTTTVTYQSGGTFGTLIAGNPQ